MVIFALSVLFGLLGSSMKPVPLLAVLAPTLAVFVSASARVTGATGLETVGSFYVNLAGAELAYLAAIFVRHWSHNDTGASMGGWVAHKSQGI